MGKAAHILCPACEMNCHPQSNFCLNCGTRVIHCLNPIRNSGILACEPKAAKRRAASKSVPVIPSALACTLLFAFGILTQPERMSLHFNSYLQTWF